MTQIATKARIACAANERTDGGFGEGATANLADGVRWGSIRSIPVAAIASTHGRPSVKDKTLYTPRRVTITFTVSAMILRSRVIE